MVGVLISSQENEKKKIVADFHVLGIFIAKKQDLREKKSICDAPLRGKTME
jgi:hypothetical protein